jgi:hypothetical protein
MKQRKPRKSKKSIAKRGVLIYDIAVLPNGWTLMKMLEAYRRDKIVIYNSSAAGNMGQKNSDNKPFVINNVTSIKLIDLSDKNEIEF